MALLVLLVGLVPLGYAAYLLFREQPPRIVSVTPTQIQQVPDSFTLTIKGEHLRPYMRVSAGAQQGRAFLFKTTEEAEVPFAAMPPGQYDIVLFDQAQERFRLPGALTITPMGLPATQVVAVGGFGNLDAATAAKLTAGMRLPEAGEVLAVGKPMPDVTDVFAGGKLVGVPRPDALRLPAIVQFNCHLRTQGGSPYCVVGDTNVSPPALLLLETPLGKVPFQVERVRGPQPLIAVTVDVKLAGSPSVLSLVTPGDTDLGGTTNELALQARVASAGAMVTLGPASAERTVRLTAQLQNVGNRWLYDSTPIRVGSAIQLRTSRYEATGTVMVLPPADGTGTVRP